MTRKSDKNLRITVIVKDGEIKGISTDRDIDLTLTILDADAKEGIAEEDDYEEDEVITPLDFTGLN
jgi:hypothetical protein